MQTSKKCKTRSLSNYTNNLTNLLNLCLIESVCLTKKVNLIKVTKLSKSKTKIKHSRTMVEAETYELMIKFLLKKNKPRSAFII